MDQQIMEACQLLAEQEHLKVPIKAITKEALITGVSTLARSILYGPVFGLVMGTTLATGVRAVTNMESTYYKPVSEILRDDLTSIQNRKLVAAVKNVLRNLKAGDAYVLVALIRKESSLKEAVVREIDGFLWNELNMKMTK